MAPIYLGNYSQLLSAFTGRFDYTPATLYWFFSCCHCQRISVFVLHILRVDIRVWRGTHDKNTGGFPPKMETILIERVPHFTGSLAQTSFLVPSKDQDST